MPCPDEMVHVAELIRPQEAFRKSHCSHVKVLVAHEPGASDDWAGKLIASCYKTRQCGPPVESVGLPNHA